MVKRKSSQISQMAALYALGALEKEEARRFAELLSESPEALSDAQVFGSITEKLAQSLPRRAPSPGLKERILAAAEKSKARARAAQAMQQMLPVSKNGLAYMKAAADGGWLPLPVTGAFVKLLSFDSASSYALVLGKLDPGSRYPAHTHKHPEEIFMISGDLHVGEEVLRAGDFHHAAAGSQHPVNWSEQGCVLICVLSKADLMNQLG
jgi:anti-sigma factor ChrR (cupin superfamily)